MNHIIFAAFVVFFAIQGTSAVVTPEGITCDSAYQITLKTSLLATLGVTNVTVDNLYIYGDQHTFPNGSGAECLPVTKGSGFVQFGNLTFNKCKPHNQTNSTHYVYTYTVWRDNRNVTWPVDRYTVNSLNMTCVVERSYTVSSQLGIHPLIVYVQNTTDPVIGAYTISLGLYKDANYSTAFINNEQVNVPEKVYVKIWMVHPPNHAGEDKHSIWIDTCYAHQTTTVLKTYVMISNQNPVQNAWTKSGDVVIELNQLSEIAKWFFKSFVWNAVDFNVQRIYVTCEVYLAASPGSGRRKRRDLSSLDEASTALTLTTGPLQVRQVRKLPGRG